MHANLDEMTVRLRDEILAGRLSRRAVLRRGMALGLSAPVIAALLAACGGDDDDDNETPAVPATPATQATPAAGTTPAAAATPTEAADATPAPAEPTATTAAAATATTAPVAPTAGTGQGRGQGDLLRVLYWQAATILNTHLSQGDKDTCPANLVLEPLHYFDQQGEIVLALAAEVPSVENGTLAADGMSVTHTLKPGIVWSDGTPLTAEDFKFTWEYVTDPATSSGGIALYGVVTGFEVIDDLTFTMSFDNPNPAWFNLFSGSSGIVLPKHILEEFKGAKAGEAPFNLAPIGTGPYVVDEFKPGDVITYSINENYREADKPYFKNVEFKGGGDPDSAARAVLQSGETDYAINLTVQKEVFEEMIASGEEGYIDPLPALQVEYIWIQHADPNAEVDGARAEPSTQHPFLSDLTVRQAWNVGTDRATIAGELYIEGGAIPTPNFLIAPAAFNSQNTSFSFDLAAASALLDEAGWVLDGNVRTKDGVEMRVVHQTTNNPIRNRTQAILKADWEAMGVPTEVKAIDGGVFFSSDTGNPDTAGKFWADFQEYANGITSPYPIDYMSVMKSDEPETDISQKANNWTGPNNTRWVNEEFNTAFQSARTELDLDKQAELFITMNDLIIDNVAVIPLFQRAWVAGISNKLKGINRSTFTSDCYDIANWYFEE